MTSRRLFQMILPLTLGAFTLQGGSAIQRWTASRAVVQVERATDRIWAVEQALPKNLADRHLLLLRQASEQDPLLIQVGIDSGIQYLLSNRPRSAVRVLKASLELEQRAEIYANLGTAYLMLGEREKAEHAFELAITLDRSLKRRIDGLLTSAAP